METLGKFALIIAGTSFVTHVNTGGRPGRSAQSCSESSTLTSGPMTIVGGMSPWSMALCSASETCAPHMVPSGSPGYPWSVMMTPYFLPSSGL